MQTIIKDEWERRAKIYDKLDWTNRQQYLAKVLTMCDLKSGYHICDVGTGTGIIANAISEYCKKVEAIDISKDMLNIAREKHNRPNINYRLMDAENMSYKKEIFDCIISRMCFHHIKNQHKVIKNCHEALKINGIFVISEGIPPPGTRNFYNKMFKIKEKRRTYTIDDIVELLEYGHFKNIDIIVHKMEKVSMINWLENSALSKDKCSKIYNMHLDCQQYIKKAYNMNISDGDIYMDWLFAIAKGEKQ